LEKDLLSLKPSQKLFLSLRLSLKLMLTMVIILDLVDTITGLDRAEDFSLIDMDI